MGKKTTTILDDHHNGRSVYTGRDIARAAAELGRRGGKKSRRTLTKAQARKMVEAREKKRLDRKGDK